MSVKAKKIHECRESGDARRGTVLLFSLLVMFSVVIASIGLGSLILSSLQQTRIIDGAMVAYYAAESAVEDALYLARKFDGLPASFSTPQSLTNNATWTRDISGSELEIFADIPQDSFTEVALFDPDAETVATDIATVNVTWTDDCGGCSVLVASMVGWIPGGAVIWTPDTPSFKHTGGTATISIGPPNKLYKLRLRAKNADLEDVRVRAYNASSTIVSLPGRVKIDARGEFLSTRQQLTVTLPRRVPLSGLYDFVIFSECSLVKGGPVSCP